MKIISVLLVIKIHSRIRYILSKVKLVSNKYISYTLNWPGIKKGLLLIGDDLQLGMSRMIFVKIIWTVF